MPPKDDRKGNGEVALRTAVTNKLLNRLNNNTNRINKKQYELDNDDIKVSDSSEELTNRISKRVERVMSNFTGRNSVSGSNASNDDLDAIMALSQRAIKKQSDRDVSISRRTKEINDVRSEIVKANSRSVMEMVQGNKSQVSDLLTTYNMIIKLIPKMRLAIKTIANTIISPDDFTKSTLATFIEDRVDTRDRNAIIGRVDDIIETHCLNKELQNDVITYLKNGDLFFLVLSQNAHIKQLLTEDGNASSPQSLREELTKTLHRSAKSSVNIFAEGTIRTLESDALIEMLNDKRSEQTAVAYMEKTLTGEEKEFFNEFVAAFGVTDDTSSKNLATSLKKVNQFLDEEFIIATPSALYNEEQMLSSDSLQESAANFFYADTLDVSMNGVNDYSASQPPLANGEKSVTDEEKAKIMKMRLGGKERPVIRRVSKANIVPLEYNGTVLGYLHLDIVEMDPDGTVLPSDRPDNGQEANSFMPSQATGNGSMLQNMIYMGKDVPIDGDGRSTVNKKTENPNGSPGLTAVDDARINFISNVFANKLSRDTNLRLLRRNPAIKNAIYTSLCIKKLGSNEKVRVVYLKPDEVVHISRGQSIFDNVLFFAKIYIASLVTILTQNIMRGSATRIVYCEVGLDNNPANSVQQVIRDIKSKEISSVHNMDLQTILNVTGEFTDMYIPVIDGEKPISFDSIEPQNNKSLDDEFLTWLGNNIFSGIGLPSAYTSEVESVDFAKTLAMQNSRFLRDILADQMILGEGYTRLIRRIYSLTYNSNEAKLNDDEKISKANDTEMSDTAFENIINFDVNNITIRFPSPSSLNVTNINDQLSNLNSVVDAITQNIEFDKNEVSDEDKERVTNTIKNKLIRQFAPSIDWESIQHTVDETLREIKEEKIRKSISKDEKEGAGLDDDTDMM